jgi:hypothetical protein
MDNTTSTIAPRTAHQSRQLAYQSTCSKNHLIMISPQTIPNHLQVGSPIPISCVRDLATSVIIGNFQPFQAFFGSQRPTSLVWGPSLIFKCDLLFLPNKRCHERISCCRPGFSSQGYSTQNHSNLLSLIVIRPVSTRRLVPQCRKFF